GTIIPILNPTIEIPKYLNTTGRVEGNKIISIVDLRPFSNVTRNSDDIEIYPKTLFNLLQNGLILNELVTNWRSYTNNMNIVRNSAVVYSRLTGKVMDKLFAVNIDEFKSDLVSFLLAKFFLVNLCGRN